MLNKKLSLYMAGVLILSFVTFICLSASSAATNAEMKAAYDIYLKSYEEFKAAVDQNVDPEHLKPIAEKYNQALGNYQKVLKGDEAKTEEAVVPAAGVECAPAPVSSEMDVLSEAKEALASNDVVKSTAVIEKLNTVISTSKNQAEVAEAKLLLAKANVQFKNDFKSAAKLISEVLSAPGVTSEQANEAKRILNQVSEAQFRSKVSATLGEGQKNIAANRAAYADEKSGSPVPVSKIKAFLGYGNSCNNYNNTISNLMKEEPKKETSPANIEKNIEESKKKKSAVLEEHMMPVEIAPVVVPVSIPKRVLSGGRTDKKIVSITFDDGPHGKLTPELLQILKDNGVKATFFALGSSINSLPSIVKSEYAAGHVIGNHSMSHPQYTKLSLSALNNELDGCNAAIKKATGMAKPKYYRPPYGALPQALKDRAANEDFYIVLWSLDSLDWKRYEPDYTMASVLKDLKNGSVMLFHDIHPTTIALMKKLLPRIKNLGYKFVSLDEVYGMTEVSENASDPVINEETPADNAPPAGSKSGVINNPGSSVNVRATPWGTVLASYKDGTPVTVVGSDGDWYKIKYNDGYAYVSSKYVKVR